MQQAPKKWVGFVQAVAVAMVPACWPSGDFAMAPSQEPWARPTSGRFDPSVLEASGNDADAGRPRLAAATARLVCRPPSEEVARLAQGPYFDQPVPKRVHQIWFGDPAKRDPSRSAQWQDHCERFGYSYRLWTEDDLEELHTFLPPDNFTALLAMLHDKYYHGASDIVRLGVLRQQGGIYADIDVSPPQRDHQVVEVAEVLPMRNILFSGEHVPRDLGTGSFFVANWFLMAAPQHPLLIHLQRTLVDNIESFMDTPLTEHTSAFVGPSYLTGPYFVSCNLFGAFGAVTAADLMRWQMLH